MSAEKLAVYVVRRPGSDGSHEVISAWPDIYAAKYEAQRWSYDFKEAWDYVPATLVLEENNDETTTTRMGESL